MIRINSKGYEISKGTEEISGLQRALNPNVRGIQKNLKLAGYDYNFKNPVFEAALIDNKKRKFLESMENAGLLRGTKESLFEDVVKSLEFQAHGFEDKVCGHILEIPRSIKSIPKAAAYAYADAQIAADAYDWTTILDREVEQSQEIVEVDIKEKIDAAHDANKEIRFMIDLDGQPDQALFENKCRTAIEAGAKSILFKSASINPTSLVKYGTALELSKEGVHTGIFGLERKLRRLNIAPASMPSIVSLFGFKSFSIKDYSGLGIDRSQPIVYAKMPLFDEPTEGLFGKKESIDRNGEEFFTDTDYSPFKDVGRRSRIWGIMATREFHHPVYGYELVASQYALQRITKSVKKNCFDEYAEEKECLADAVDKLQLASYVV